jgi:hypothetical protein
MPGVQEYEGGRVHLPGVREEAAKAARGRLSMDRQE